MTKSYGPFATGAGSTFSETQWQTLGSAQPTGVLSGMVAFADSTGMQVKVPIGSALLQGFLFTDDAQETIAISTANASNPRIDRLVVRRDMGAKTIDYAIRVGTPFPSPSAPTLQRDAAIWEISLCQINVPANASTISAGNIVDERFNPDVCGLVTSLLGGIVPCLSTTRPTTGLVNGVTIVEIDTGAMRYWWNNAWSSPVGVTGVQPNLHMTSPVIDSGSLAIQSGGININSANQSITSGAGGFLAVSSGGDLYLRSNAGGLTHIDQGPVVFAGSLTGIQNLTMSGALSGANALNVGGDITSQRGNTTGYVFLGNTGTHYLGFDGTDFQLQGSGAFNVAGLINAAVGLSVLSGGLRLTGSTGLPNPGVGYGGQHGVGNGAVATNPQIAGSGFGPSISGVGVGWIQIGVDGALAYQPYWR